MTEKDKAYPNPDDKEPTADDKSVVPLTIEAILELIQNLGKASERCGEAAQRAATSAELTGEAMLASLSAGTLMLTPAHKAVIEDHLQLTFRLRGFLSAPRAEQRIQDELAAVAARLPGEVESRFLDPEKRVGWAMLRAAEAADAKDWGAALGRSLGSLHEGRAGSTDTTVSTSAEKIQPCS